MAARASDNSTRTTGEEPRLKGSLRDALAAATASLMPQPRADTVTPTVESNRSPPVSGAQPLPPPPPPAVVSAGSDEQAANPPPPKTGDPFVAPAPEQHAMPTRVVRPRATKAARSEVSPVTQRLRAKAPAEALRFHQNPVVGWLVVVGGPGLGACRPIYEGNNSIGRAPSQRIPLDFGDDGISSEEQAYIRYDAADRTFLLVPNMAKTNIVALNDKKPTVAVPLAAMDLVTVGRTQLCFVPFCGPEFDWAELTYG